MAEKVLTVCPYCGSGCKLNLLVENGSIIGAEPANGVTNEGELCLKGYYGWDFLNDTKLLTPRLKKPLLREHRGFAKALPCELFREEVPNNDSCHCS